MELTNGFFNHDAQAGGFYPRSHVGIDLDSFGFRQNILIEGIRGTGKTHILKMVERYYFENFEDMRILPIYVSLAQINEHARKDPNEFRLHLYTYVVQRCLETIEKYQDEIEPESTIIQEALDAIRKLFGISSKSDIKIIISDLRKTADQLIYELQFDLTSETFRTKAGTKEKIGAKFGASTNLTSPAIKNKISSEIATEYSRTDEVENQMMFMGSRLAHQNASSFIVEFLKQLQILLDLEYSLILLDEVSEADASAQVEVFRLFRTIRGSGSAVADRENCAYFIGTVYPRGETYYPTREKDGISFDPGNDCTMEFIQWDETDLNTYTSFFRDMTLNRAREILAYNFGWDSLMNDLFDQEDAFLLSAYASHGIPRRYWEILKRGYDPVSMKITLNRVGIAVQEIVNNQILAHSTITKEDIYFIYYLISILAKGNQVIRRKNKGRGKSNPNPIPQNIYFSVNHRFRDMLRRLLMQGAIHDKSRMRTISKPKRPQPMFAADIGLVYTYRIIPPKQLVAVIQRDIPKLPASDFDQAPEISKVAMKDIYEEGIEVVPDLQTREEDDDLDLITQSETQSSEGILNLTLTSLSGIVSDYKDGKRGSVIPDDGSNKYTFQVNNIHPDSVGKIKNGSKVFFKAHINGDARIAKQVSLAKNNKTPQNAKAISEGIIKSYQEGYFGLIEVLDGGPFAYFSSENIQIENRNTLQQGDRVTFNLVSTPKGRQALNVGAKQVIVKPSTEQLDEVAKYVISYVQNSDIPISLGALATQIKNHFGDTVTNTQWYGYGGLKSLLLQLNLTPLVLSPFGPSYLYDPKLHDDPAMMKENFVDLVPQPNVVNLLELKFVEKYPNLFDIAKKANTLTQIPPYLPEEYAFILRVIANEVNNNGFDMSKTQISVRDKCRENGLRIARKAVNRIFLQITHSGYNIGMQSENALTIGEAIILNIISFGRINGVMFDEQEQNMLRKWILGSVS